MKLLATAVKAEKWGGAGLRHPVSDIWTTTKAEKITAPPSAYRVIAQRRRRCNRIGRAKLTSGTRK